MDVFENAEFLFTFLVFAVALISTATIIVAVFDAYDARQSRKWLDSWRRDRE